MVLILGTSAVVRGAALSADLSIQPHQISPNPINPPGPINYVFIVSNNGPDAASNLVFTDVLPAGTTFLEAGDPDTICETPPVGGTGTVVCPLPTLPANSWFGPFIVSVRLSADNAGPVVNTATVSSDTPDPNTSNNSATITTDLTVPVPISKVGLVLLALGLAAGGLLFAKR
ncbi:MAG TPA: DUF11 domain-containing protein [Thermoanaerobaculia bacterium]|nr:DUF11 domain-containing protein [Thermoanaerobaculia bacterium]